VKGTDIVQNLPVAEPVRPADGPFAAFSGFCFGILHFIINFTYANGKFKKTEI